MKKRFLFIVCGAALLLSGCDYRNEIIELHKEMDGIKALFNPLDTRVLKLEEQASRVDVTIKSLEEADKQLDGYIKDLQKETGKINDRITQLDQAFKESIDTVKGNIRAEMQNMKDGIDGTIGLIQSDVLVLQQENARIEGMINNLKNYVEGDLTNYINAQDTSIIKWTEGTFSTLEQYKQVVEDIATLTNGIKDVNERITKLDTDLRNKIDNDIANAKSELSSELQQKVTEITNAYTEAVREAKEQITAAYEESIRIAVNDLDQSIRSWVCDTLNFYYTKAQVDAKLAILKDNIDENDRLTKESIANLYIELEDTKIEITEAYKQYITDACANGGEINEAIKKQVGDLQAQLTARIVRIEDQVDAYGERLTTLESKVRTIEGQIVEIEGSIETLKGVDEELKGYIDIINAIIGEVPSPYNSTIMKDIDSLMRKDSNLQTMIENLRHYIDNDLKSYIDAGDFAVKDWMETSLKSYYKQTEVDALLNAIRTDISTTNSNLSVVRDSLRILDGKINDITREGGILDTKISQAQNEFQTWVLTGFFTKDQVGGKIDSLASALNGKIDGLNSAISALSSSLDTAKTNIRNQIAADKDYILDSLDRVKSQTQDSLEQARIDILKQLAESEARVLDSIANAKASALDSVNRAKQDALNQLQAQKEALEKKIEDTEAALTEAYEAAIKHSIDSLGGVVGKALLDSMTALRGGYTGSMQDLKNEIDALSGRATTLESDVATLQSDVFTLQGEVEGLKTRISAAEADIIKIQGDITDLQQADIDIRTSITNLENALRDKIQADSTVLRGLINDLQDADIAINARIDDINTDISGINTSISHIENDIIPTLATKDSLRNVAADLAALTARVGTNEANIADLQTRVGTLETLVNRLTGRLDDLENLVQSIVYIPEYSDGKCSIPFEYDSKGARVFTDADKVFDMKFKVNSNDPDIDEMIVKYNITALYIQTLTRSGFTQTLPITSKTCDDGVLTLTIDGKDVLDQDFIEGKKGFCVAANILDERTTDDGTKKNTNICSEFIPLCPQARNEAPNFYLDKYDVELNADGTGSVEVSIHSGNTSRRWYVQNGVDSFASYEILDATYHEGGIMTSSYYTGSGRFVIKPKAANESSSAKTGKITISNNLDDAKLEINVKQEVLGQTFVSFTPDTDPIEFGKDAVTEANAYSIAVVTSDGGKNWTVSSNKTWAQVRNNNGTAKIWVDANDTFAERTATVTFKARSDTRTFTVKQAARVPVGTLTFDPESATVIFDTKGKIGDNNYKDVTVSGDSFNDWTVAKADNSQTWFNVEKRTGGNANKFRITVGNQNTTKEDRTGTINVTPAGSDTPISYTFTQEYVGERLTANPYETDYRGTNSYDMHVWSSDDTYSGCSARVSSEYSEWLSVEGSIKTHNASSRWDSTYHYVTVKVERNTALSAREGYVTLVHGSGEETQVKVTQTASPDQTLSANDVDGISARGVEDQRLNVTSVPSGYGFDGCKVTVDAEYSSWLSVSSGTISSQGRVNYTVKENTSSTSRTGYITLTSATGHVTKVKLTQKPLRFSVSTTSMTSGSSMTITIKAKQEVTVTSNKTNRLTLKESGTQSSFTSKTYKNDGSEDMVITLIPTNSWSGFMSYTFTVKSTADSSDSVDVTVN